MDFHQPRSESRILRDMAAELKTADRAELREIGTAVESGALAFADVNASSGYREFLAECADQLSAMTEEEFFASENQDEESGPARAAATADQDREEPGEPESYLLPAHPPRRDTHRW
ncbi:hypothetical protein B0I33_106379 [Prauserella shujinwangii]|uniref:Uncharacterized protein n=1 Tax=Prauserella shujinwangii TaxID=1453103 RepID=A0A2T0LU63_9PSEU|nr:hypothetical protein [Prauserella shujinwangii]PRX47277.1 hypothetical protein B0I33_106379 [Prauserella shujinwangii]